MADMVIPNVGKLLWLEWALTGDGSTYEDLVVELYSSNTTPVDASILTDFTIATFPGYDLVTLARADFSTPVIVADVAQSTGEPTPTYTCTGGGGQLVYGWVMRGATSGVLLAAQRFASARNMVAGVSESLDPFTLSLQSIA